MLACGLLKIIGLQGSPSLLRGLPSGRKPPPLWITASLPMAVAAALPRRAALLFGGPFDRQSWFQTLHEIKRLKSRALLKLRTPQVITYLHGPMSSLHGAVPRMRKCKKHFTLAIAAYLEAKESRNAHAT